jgi:pimeloyl-ACP methyl ester carboxylesterase
MIVPNMISAAQIVICSAVFFIACNDVRTKESMTPTEEIRKDSSSGYADINGLKIYYEIHGSGDPLVLIHGGGSTIQTTFGRVLHLFAQKHKVIAVELQAHGHTADIDRPLSFEHDADDVAALLNYLGVARTDVFGFSNGASTTLQIAIRHPELVNKIVVASTMFRKSGSYPWFWEMMSHPSFEDMPQPLKDAFLAINPDSNALYRMYERDVARMQSFTDIGEEDIRAIQAPALIIAGTADVVSPEHAVEIYRLLPNAELALLPGVHGEYIGEVTTPQDSSFINGTVALVEKFLGKPGPGK